MAFVTLILYLYLESYVVVFQLCIPNFSVLFNVIKFIFAVHQ